MGGQISLIDVKSELGVRSSGCRNCEQLTYPLSFSEANTALERALMVSSWEAKVEVHFQIYPFAELSEERPQVGLGLFLSGAVQLPLHAPFHVILSGIQLLGPNSQEELQGASTSVSWCHLVTSRHIRQNTGLSKQGKVSFLEKSELRK